MALYESELMHKAAPFIEKLQKLNIDVSYSGDSFRDYLFMLELSIKGIKKGKLSIYYKPSKNTFSLKKQIKDAEFEKIVDGIWGKLNGFETYDEQSGIYEAFVDGSFMNGVTGYGAVVYLGDKLATKLSGTIVDTEFRQFGGELKSVIETLKWCRDNGVKQIRINYDYQGIEKFATGKWKAGNSLSQEYIDFIKALDFKPEWRHIKSHTGNAKNDEADVLAKEACKGNYAP